MLETLSTESSERVATSNLCANTAEGCEMFENTFDGIPVSKGSALVLSSNDPWSANRWRFIP
jgi:hypothetical protein